MIQFIECIAVAAEEQVTLYTFGIGKNIAIAGIYF